MKILQRDNINLIDYKYRYLNLMVNYIQTDKKTKKKSIQRKKILELYNTKFATNRWNYEDIMDNLSFVINNSSFITKKNIKKLCNKEILRVKQNGYYVTYGGVEINGYQILLSESNRGSDLHFVKIPNKGEFDDILLILIEKLNSIL